MRGCYLCNIFIFQGDNVFIKIGYEGEICVVEKFFKFPVFWGLRRCAAPRYPLQCFLFHKKRFPLLSLTLLNKIYPIIINIPTSTI